MSVDATRIASVCEEVRNIMLVRATLMNTAQPMHIGATDKGSARRARARAKARRVKMATARGREAASRKSARESK